MKKNILQTFRSGRTCLINVGLTHASATLQTAVARSDFFSVTDLAVSTITLKDPTGCFAHTSKIRLFTNAMKKCLHLPSLQCRWSKEQHRAEKEAQMGAFLKNRVNV